MARIIVEEEEGYGCLIAVLLCYIHICLWVAMAVFILLLLIVCADSRYSKLRRSVSKDSTKSFNILKIRHGDGERFFEMGI
jgi:hypothetical protein